MYGTNKNYKCGQVERRIASCQWSRTFFSGYSNANSKAAVEEDNQLVDQGNEYALETRGASIPKKNVTSFFLKGSTKEPEALIPLSDGVYALYFVSEAVIYCGIFDKSYAQAMASAYLSEIRKEFEKLYEPSRINNASVAFQFMDFESFIEKSKKVFLQSKNHKLSQVSGNLADIHRVMTRSLADVVSRGEDIEHLSQGSELVLGQSDEYRKVTVELNRAKWYQKWGAIAAIILGLVLVYYVRKWYNS